ncbi:MAG: hypothetical protein ABUL72_03505 [Armatimonadota bacterium]
MEVVFDPRTFAAMRADLSARIGSSISGLALLDADSNVSALDEGLAETIGLEASEVIGRPLPWVFGKLGLPKKTDPSEVMNRPVDLPNGQQVAMGLTADGLALSLIGEATIVKPAAEPIPTMAVVSLPTEPKVKPAPKPPEVPASAGIDDFAVALGACRDGEDLALVIEAWLPDLVPGSRGTYALNAGDRAVVTATWPLGFSVKPTQFSTDRCMALRLGHTFPDTETKIPLACRHGIDGICVLVMWSGQILGVLSAESADKARLERVARVLAPYAFRLEE